MMKRFGAGRVLQTQPAHRYAARRARRLQPNGGGMPHILVIDDDTSVRIAIRMLLEHEGYSVTLAEDGRSGLEAIETTAPLDLVLIDIFMPGMDGLETIKSLHARVPDLPIVAMSGFMFRGSSAPAPDFLTMATQLGATRSLHKPFRPRELMQAVADCLGPHVPEELPHVVGRNGH
jgi:CheY-like chemotaxis protein